MVGFVLHPTIYRAWPGHFDLDLTRPHEMGATRSHEKLDEPAGNSSLYAFGHTCPPWQLSALLSKGGPSYRRDKLELWTLGARLKLVRVQLKLLLKFPPGILRPLYYKGG